MFDIRAIRNDSAAFDAAVARRGVGLAVAAGLLAVDRARCEALEAAPAARTERNAKSRRIGAVKAAGDEADARALIAAVVALKARLQEGEETGRRLTAELDEALHRQPNAPAAEVSDGAD